MEKQPHGFGVGLQRGSLSIRRPSQVKLLVSKEEGWPPLTPLVPWGMGGWLAFPVIPLDCHICILGLACTPAHL